MIVTTPPGKNVHYTAVPKSELPITVQIDNDGEWDNWGAIKFSGHRILLYGGYTYRFVIGKPGPDCCVEYTEIDVTEANPRVHLPDLPPTTTSSPTTT